MERDLQLLEDSQSLVLPNVTLQDAGTYLCMLFAPVGHQIEEGQIQLTVYGKCNDMHIWVFSVVLTHKLKPWSFWITLLYGDENFAVTYIWDTLYYLWLYGYR